MKILITGSSGMLGQALCEALSGKYEVVGLDVVRVQGTGYRVQRFIECDIIDRERTISAVGSISPDVIVHAAAYTDVDGCEVNPDKAHRVNARGTETIALASHKCAALLYYISTDFIFDGEKKSAYIEQDRPAPVNAYGRSKLEGERYVQSILKEFIIVRSSWLFGKGGRNFVDTILKKAQNEKEVKVVNDQFGSPTYSKDLSQAICKLISLSNSQNDIYHISNSGSCSWFELVLAIKEIADLNINITPISTQDYNSPTRRPKMSILENGRYQERIGKKLRHWREALEEYLLDESRKTDK